MAFTTKDTFTFDHTAQPDYPNWIPSVTKTNMNARGEELRLALNAVVDLLNATATGASGAKFIGAETIAGLTGNDVQTLLAALKIAIDGVVLGTIPDASLTYAKFNMSLKSLPMFPQNELINLDGMTIGSLTLTLIPVILGTVNLA